MTTLIAPEEAPKALRDRADERPTDAPHARCWAGGFGVAAGLLLVAAMPIYVIRGVPPSLDDPAAFAAYLTRNNANVLTGVVVDTLYGVAAGRA